MESVNYTHDHLENLRRDAERMADTVRYLVTAFDSTDELLRRDEEISCLRALSEKIIQGLKQLRSQEHSASLSQAEVNIMVSLCGLATEIASKTLNSKSLSTLSNAAGTVSQKKLPFGDVLLGIGLGGLPGDVSVISISKMARGSKQTEDQVKERLLQNGLLLLDDEAFQSLIDRLIEEILDGYLHLPVSRETLFNTAAIANRKPTSSKIKIGYTVSPVGPGGASLQNDSKP